jgi:hypothetical protein
MATSIGSTGITFGNSTTQNAAAIISITAGTGLTGGTITHPSGTIGLDVYTGSDSQNTSFPVGSTVLVETFSTQYNRNASATIYRPNSTGDYFTISSGSATALAGTWRARGRIKDTIFVDSETGIETYLYYLFQRTA